MRATLPGLKSSMVAVVLAIVTMSLSLSVLAAEQVIFSVLTGNNEAFFTEYVQGFSAKHPEVEPVLATLGSGQVLTLISAGTPPVVQKRGVETYYEMAASGALQDMSGEVERRGVDLSQFFPAVVAAAWYRGGSYALPADGDGTPEVFGISGMPHVGQVGTMGSAWGARWFGEEYNYIGNTPEMRAAITYFVLPLATDPATAAQVALADGGVPTLRGALPLWMERLDYSPEMLDTLISTMEVAMPRGTEYGPHVALNNQIRDAVAALVERQSISLDQVFKQIRAAVAGTAQN